LSNPSKYRTDGLASDFSPTKVIVENLRSGGFLS
jgi:hypothetical protein